MPGNSTASEGALQTLRIADFTAGIVNQDYSAAVASSTLYRVPNSGNLISASINTYGVVGLPKGGLLLGPTVVGAKTVSLQNTTMGTTTCIVGGVLNFIDGVFDNNSGLTTLVAVRTTGGGTFGNFYDLSGHNVVSGNGVISFTVGDMLPFITTLFSSGAGGFLNCIGVGNNSGGLGGAGIAVIPRWTTGTPRGAITISSAKGIAFAANGRVWMMQNGNSFAFNTANDTLFFNEISYTDPTDGVVDNTSIGTQKTLIDYDNPSTFGGWGSVSSSNILLVKTGSGGVIVSGDIFNPTITRAPAVVGTGGLVGQTAFTPLGLVYRSNLNGVWAWSGGAAAQKISSSISDRTWDGATYLNSYNVQLFRNFIFTDAGMFYDIQTGAWWRLPPWMNNGTNFTQISYPNYYSLFNNTFSQDFIGWSPSAATSATSIAGTAYALGNDQASVYVKPPATYYNSFWESNPITISTDEIAEVQELSIVMQGWGTLYVSTLGVNGAVLSSRSLVVQASTYKRVRLVVSFETDVLTLQIGFNNGLDASGNAISGAPSTTAIPIIESVEVKYLARFPVPVAS